VKSLKKTPLNKVHHALKAKMVDFVGWEMPLNYSPGILAEHLTTRKFGGLFDISHMGRFVIRGQDALPFLQYVLTNNAAALQPGQSQYTIIPNESGGAVDDTYLYRLDKNEYLLVVNAANMEKDWAWFQNYKPKFPQLILEDRGARIAMLSLQGPRAKAVLETILGDIRKLPEPARNSLTTVEMFDTMVTIARTGYTGEPIRFELFPTAEIAVRLWNKLLEVGKKEGIAPIGLGARDTLRLEAGCDFLTIGQYLPPSLRHHKVVRYVPPEEFEEYSNIGKQLGFRRVVSGSLVRSSFHAAETYLLAAKEAG